MTLAILPLFAFLPMPVVHAVPRSSYSWPLQGRILRGFEKQAGHYGEGGHQGLDMAARPGEQVRCAAEGTVTWIGEVPAGRFVSVEHSGGARTVYLDLERIEVSKGARVSRGQAIGTVAGTRDTSCTGSHLHFGAYLHGQPVDPHLLFSGVDTRSFIRLCPVGGPGGSPRGHPVTEPGDGGFWSGGKTIFRPVSVVARPFAGAFKALKAGVSSAWKGVAAGGRWIGRSAALLWNRYIYRGLAVACRAIGRAFVYVWSNRWVQAVVAGLAAALVIVVVIVLAVVAAGVSLVAAVIAAVVGAVACLGMCIYYAATHATNFSFAGCFLQSLAAGAVAAGLAASIATLAGAFSAGWAELGLWGSIKSAFWSGMYSAGFDTASNFLFTGQFSWKKMIIAFGVGAFAGAVGKVLARGLSPGRILEFFSTSASEGRSTIVGIGEQVLIFMKDGGQAFQGTLLWVRDAAVTLGSKLAYLGFSGTFGLTFNVAVNVITGRPITFSGCLASFMTGVAMGAISLSFGMHGLDGLLKKFRVFREGIGRVIRPFVANVIRKTISRSIEGGLKNLIKRLTGEKEVAR